MKKRFHLATVIGISLLVAALTYTLTYAAVQRRYSEQLSQEQQTSKRFAKLIRMLDIIDSDFVGDYDSEELMDGAAEGIIAGTGDRWSFYMNEEDYKEYRASVANDYAGIGVTVVYDEEAGGLRVAKLHAGSPADEVGLRYKDLIVSVDSKKVTDLIDELGYSEAVEEIRGVAGTNVVLGVERDGVLKNYTVTRGQYLNNPVSSEILDGNIGYIKIENFDSRANVNFADALSKLLAAEVEGLIFDVRDNGGGYKDVMVDMLDMLCPEGVLFTMRDKRGNEQVDYSDADEVDLPMAVIVNEDSYSAAEFFAAALQEYGKAYVVGTGTSGKGYSQVTIELGDGSAMNLSVNEYFTPKGRSLIGTGLTPDYKVSSNYDTNLLLLDHADDEQLQTAIARVTVDIEQYRAAHPAPAEEEPGEGE